MKRRIIGIVAVTSVAALAAAAFALSAQAAPWQHTTTPASSESPAAGDVEPASTPEAPTSEAPAAEPAAEPAAALDPMAADYNPYTDPANPDYVTPAAKADWYAKNSVVRKCMTDLGLGFETMPWWLGGSPQPKGLDNNQTIAWTIGYYGENYMSPTGGPEEAGCSGLMQLIDDGVIAAPPVPVPADPVGLPTERQTWLAYQDLVRSCMKERGYEYLYWEWWNPKYQTPFDPLATEPEPFAPQPQDQTEEQAAAWTLALNGDAEPFPDYRWEDAGCNGYATHASGNDNMH
ncbi:hypothetical protein [Microterricola viridarii]|uniref:Uncharacterized protein n=1 Tax=Microterricola viridarii TaxID=412690 RepID=A0A109QY90_9MICO|nr:hypothetical protein [Microterricola viridarii]AMB60065.1 hypothetical protein AWU67_15705 [Microterricola viridarii]